MIIDLAVENLAIIERAQVSLGPGYTALTGETGAGKSLLIDAIELALGGRADADLVRTGAARATVSLTLDLGGRPELQILCSEAGADLEEGLLYIQREISAEGRSTARIGGRMVPIGALRRLGESLVDLHGQHEHQSLLDAGRHCSYLDAWIGEEARSLLNRLGEIHGTASDARRRLNQLQMDVRQREQRIDMLRFQVREIDEAGIHEGEFEDVETRLARLRNAERLQESMAVSMEELAGGDASALDALGSAVRRLEESARLDPTLESAIIPLRDALFSTEEGIRLLRLNALSLEADPGRLEELAGRLDTLRKLRRKYGESESQVLAFLAEANDELSSLESAEESQEALKAECSRLEAELSAVAASLTQLRNAQSSKFADLVQVQLQDLGMTAACFSVAFQPKEIDSTGGDLVEFYFTDNSGESPRALARIASGGEISRVMLAIKTVLAGRAGVPTLIFDEVDAGLGGRVAAIVGRKLEELSRDYQVIVISHLPQIAGRATHHYHIEKADSGGRTVTRVVPLIGEERVAEIARMLAGEEISSSAIANARELLGC